MFFAGARSFFFRLIYFNVGILTLTFHLRKVVNKYTLRMFHAHFRRKMKNIEAGTKNIILIKKECSYEEYAKNISGSLPQKKLRTLRPGQENTILKKDCSWIFV